MATFTDLIGGLEEQRRKATLQGRPLSEAEIRGSTAGYFDAASNRLAQAKSLSQQKEQFGITTAQNQALQTQRIEADMATQAKTLAEQKRAEEERIRIQDQQLQQQQQATIWEKEAAEKAQKTASRQSAISTAALGAYGGFQVASTIGPFLGRLLGISGSTATAAGKGLGAIGGGLLGWALGG